jgi:hypothetical protein
VASVIGRLDELRIILTDDDEPAFGPTTSGACSESMAT